MDPQVTSFSIRPFGLDGYSYIWVFSTANMSGSPLASLRGNSLTVFDAGQFAEAGGLTRVINIAGTYSPFQVGSTFR